MQWALGLETRHLLLELRTSPFALGPSISSTVAFAPRRQNSIEIFQLDVARTPPKNLGDRVISAEAEGADSEYCTANGRE
jgi:hypothetical protein